MEESKGLYQKMAAVMGKCGYIKKRGRNTVQGYDYVMAADIAGEMGSLLAEHGLAFAPVEQEWDWDTRESSRGGALFVCKLHVKYSLLDTETGQSIIIPSFGEGMDSGDKAAYKAMTGALKYALIQTFLIAAGDDPEEETEDKQVKTDGNQPKVVVKDDPKVCPVCNKAAIIKGKPEFGGGYVCYKRFGGCGEKFTDSDSRLGLGVHGGVHNGSDEANPERQTITGEQVDELRGWCVTFGVDPRTVLKQYQMRDPSVKTFEDLTPEMFEHASKVFASKKEKQTKLN